jgi:hypothetical protein
LSYSYSQTNNSLLVVTDLLPTLNIGHSQVCSLFATNLNFSMRHPVVILTVTEVFIPTFHGFHTASSSCDDLLCSP